MFNEGSGISDITKIEIKEHQSLIIKRITSYLSKLNMREKVVFRYSAENEILFIKNNERGNHYLIIGHEVNDLSYGFVGKKIGEYKTTHFSIINSFENIVSEFVNA